MSKHSKRLKSWTYVYAALIIAVVFASQSGAQTTRDLGSVSPVAQGSAAPFLSVDPVVKRSDL